MFLKESDSIDEEIDQLARSNNPVYILARDRLQRRYRYLVTLKKQPAVSEQPISPAGAVSNHSLANCETKVALQGLPSLLTLSETPLMLPTRYPSVEAGADRREANLGVSSSESSQQTGLPSFP